MGQKEKEQAIILQVVSQVGGGIDRIEHAEQGEIVGINFSGLGLTEVPAALSQLSNLQQLDLSGNQLTEVPAALGQLSNLQTLDLDENPSLLTPPPEIIAQGTHEILVFLQELLRASVRRYEAKLLLVGEGKTGKSSLVRALYGKEFDSSLETTHGIDVDCLTLPHPHRSAQPLVLNTWDFGGQDIYYATHQFFLTRRSLYLVVWNARAGALQSKLDYWLDTIRVLAPDAPVLLVATHIDERAPDLNEQQYRAAYPQIVAVLQVSNKTGEGLEQVKQAIAHWAAQLPLVGQPWPLSWMHVEQALTACPDHHISAQTYLDLCTANGVHAELAQGTLGGYLHDLGKVLYFRDDPVLRTLVVLKPNWVTKAISLILEDDGIREAQGIVAHADLPRIWTVDEQGHPYDRSLHPIFLRLMERFDLSYQIDPMIPGMSPTHSLIPQLLPYQPPSPLPAWPSVGMDAPESVHVEMVYRFDFVPAGVMSWFIVRTHRYTRNQHWREGALLAYQGHVARVELIPMLRELRLVVWGVQPYTFFVILKETLDLILTRFAGLRVRREVPCICHLQRGATQPCREVYRYEEDLVRRLEHGKETIQCPESYEDVSVLQLLYGIHIKTASAVMADVEAGQRKILQQLMVLQQHDTLLLQQVRQLAEWHVRTFTRLWNLEMQKMEAECPNTFFFPACSLQNTAQSQELDQHRLHLAPGLSASSGTAWCGRSL
jgi:internalin A